MLGQHPSSKFLRLIHHLPNLAKLFWRLFRDSRVPAYKKILPYTAGIVCLAYIIMPFDALPDPLAFLGQLDDLTVVLLVMIPSMWGFVRTCPRDLVKEHTRYISGGS